MAVQFVDPRGEPAAAAEPYELADPLDDGVVVGLMANGFPDSVAFLDRVEEALGATVPGATFRRYDKGNASALASDELLDTIAAECRTVVAAYGH